MYIAIRRKAKYYLILLLYLMICFPGGMALAEGAVYQGKNGETIRCLVGGGDKVYLLTSQRVVELTYQDGTAVQQEIAGNPWDVSFLCATPGGLVGITAQNDCYLLDGGAWSKVDLASNDPALMEPNLIVFKAAASGDDIYESIYDPMTGSNRCFLLNPKAGTVQEIPDLHPTSVAAWRQGQLLFTADDENGNTLLYACDTVDRVSSPLIIDNAPGFFTALTYDAGNDMLYAAGPDNIVCSKAGGAFQPILPLKYVNGLAPLHSDCLAVWSGSNVYLCSTKAGSAAGSLTVMNVSTRFDTAFTANTGIALTAYENTGMGVMEHMSYALASRDGTVDIYGFLTYTGLKTVKEKGMYVDLGESAILKQNAKGLYPVLQRLAYDGEKLAAWPISVQPLLHDADEEILAQYGLSAPETFDALMDLIPKLTEADILSENGLRVFDTVDCSKEGLLKYFTRQYLFARQKNGEAVSFDTDLFRHIAGRIFEEAPESDPAGPGTGEESPLFTLASVSSVIHEGMIPPFRLDRDDPAIETMVYVAVVNPYSPRREQAMRYLEFISGQRDEESYSYYVDMQDPWLSPYMQDELYRLNQALEREKARTVKPEEEKARQEVIALLESDIARCEENKYLVTTAAIQLYHRLSEQFVAGENSLIQYDATLDGLIDQWLAGRYDLDGFITAMDGKVRQVYAENGM